MPPVPRPISEARVQTTLSRRYMTQLCKHFEHRVPVVVEEDRGRIEFPAGICRIDAEAETLVLRVTAADEGGIETLEDVVGRHLLRFAFREQLNVDWTRRQETAG